MVTTLHMALHIYILHSGWRALAKNTIMGHYNIIRHSFVIQCIVLHFLCCTLFNVLNVAAVALYKFTNAFTYSSIFFQVFSWAFWEAMLLLHTVKMFKLFTLFKLISCFSKCSGSTGVSWDWMFTAHARMLFVDYSSAFKMAFKLILELQDLLETSHSWLDQMTTDGEGGNQNLLTNISVETSFVLLIHIWLIKTH